MKTIGITGGTGFVGSRLSKLLQDSGYKVIIFTRNVRRPLTGNKLEFAEWDPPINRCDKDALEKIDAMVHLAGAGIADKRWTDERKREIVDSRVDATNFIVSQITNNAPKCKTFISASATGYYGPDQDGHPFIEADPAYNDFLGETCAKWEEAATQTPDNIRTAILRFGIVLGKESGAFKEFAKPMSMGVKPILGSGNQVVSWIHIDDLTRMILFILEHQDVKGVYNAVSPHPVTHAQLMRSIAKAKGGIKIPVPVPAFLLKLLLGEMSIEILKSCTVSADKVQAAGYEFQHPEIGEAAKDIIGK